MSAQYDTRASALYDASTKAASAGDVDAANRYWKDLVWLLWKPMEHKVPWAKKDDATPPRDSVTASRSRETNTTTTTTAE